MNCPRCNTVMTERRINFCAGDAVPPIIVLDVPARVCDRCGEQVFADEVAAVFEQIRDYRVAPSRVTPVGTFDYADALRQTSGVLVHQHEADLTIRLLVESTDAAMEILAGDHATATP